LFKQKLLDAVANLLEYGFTINPIAIEEKMTGMQ